MKRIALLLLGVAICVPSGSGQVAPSPAWSTWNGVTVGSSTGNNSSMNGKAIGTAAGSYVSWNGLQAPGSGLIATLVQHPHTYGCTSSPCSVTVSNTGAGHGIVLWSAAKYSGSGYGTSLYMTAPTGESGWKQCPNSIIGSNIIYSPAYALQCWYTPSAAGGVTSISANWTSAGLTSSSIVIDADVREYNEYAEGHIQTARHLSRGVMEQKIDEFVPDFSTPVVVYCDRGDRSALVTENLLKMGYQNVRSLRGGLQSWLESGGELEVSDRFRQRKPR